jgi:oligopeptidase B
MKKNDCSHAWISKELFEEMKARIKENDESVPYLYNSTIILPALKQVKIILFILEKKKAFQQKRRDHVGLQ